MTRDHSEPDVDPATLRLVKEAFMTTMRTSTADMLEKAFTQAEQQKSGHGLLGSDLCPVAVIMIIGPDAHGRAESVSKALAFLYETETGNSMEMTDEILPVTRPRPKGPSVN